MKVAPLVLVLALGVCAQQTLRDQAWSAWRAGVSHDSAQREALIGELRHAQRLRDARPDSEAYAYVQSLLDALIQNPGPIPSDVILPFESSWRAEVLILLNWKPSMPGNESALLDMRGHGMTDAEWDAVNDLLFSIASKPFFQRVLAEVRITHEFVVADQDVLHGGSSIGCGQSTRRFPKGFPPIALYQMWTSMILPGDMLFLDRPVATYYRRIVVPTDGQVEWNECTFPNAIRQDRLGQILASAGELSAKESYLMFHPWTTIRWKGAVEAEGEMERLLGEQSAAIERLLLDAQRRGSVRVSGMRLTIQTHVVDARTDRGVALPGVATREFVVR